MRKGWWAGVSPDLLTLPWRREVRLPIQLGAVKSAHSMSADRGSQSPPGEVTALLEAWGKGDREALDRLIPIVYGELRRLARRQLRGEAPGRTLSTTGLVHEAYLRLVDQDHARLENRRHFLNVAAQTMRRVLVDGARKRGAVKRGSGAATLRLDEAPEPMRQPDEELLALDEALSRLESFDPGLSRVVELRYFAGLTFEEAGEILGSPRPPPGATGIPRAPGSTTASPPARAEDGPPPARRRSRGLRSDWNQPAANRGSRAAVPTAA